MRHTLLTILVVLLAAGGVVYALLLVSNDLHHVSDELDVVARDMSSMTDDVRSIADDVNAIADALATDDDDDDPRQSPATARSAPGRFRPRRVRAPRVDDAATRRALRVHRTVTAAARSLPLP